MIDNLFNKIKVRRLLLIYIVLTVLTLMVLKIPLLKGIYVKDQYWGEIILNIFILTWFYATISKETTKIQSKINDYITTVDYKKILKLYLLNLGIYIGTGLCVFLGNAPIKYPSWLFIIFGISLCPIVEELIFRGVILNRLKLKFSVVPAIFASAIIFGIVHFDINILGRFFFGILSAILYIETQNIINCMIFHILHNTSIFVFPIISKYANISINHYNGFIIGILVLVILGCFVLSTILNIVYMKNNLPRKTS